MASAPRGPGLGLAAGRDHRVLKAAGVSIPEGASVGSVRDRAVRWGSVDGIEARWGSADHDGAVRAWREGRSPSW